MEKQSIKRVKKLPEIDDPGPFYRVLNKDTGEVFGIGRTEEETMKIVERFRHMFNVVVDSFEFIVYKDEMVGRKLCLSHYSYENYAA